MFLKKYININTMINLFLVINEKGKVIKRYVIGNNYKHTILGEFTIEVIIFYLRTSFIRFFS